MSAYLIFFYLYDNWTPFYLHLTVAWTIEMNFEIETRLGGLTYVHK